MNGSSPRRIRIVFIEGAGVGKTFTLNALKEQVNRWYGKKSIDIATSAGVATRLVGGTMMHTIF